MCDRFDVSSVRPRTDNFGEMRRRHAQARRPKCQRARGARTGPRLEARATSSGVNTTCWCTWSGLVASSISSSAAVLPS
jgi:hypothetical protein